MTPTTQMGRKILSLSTWSLPITPPFLLLPSLVQSAPFANGLTLRVGAEAGKKEVLLNGGKHVSPDESSPFVFQGRRGTFGIHLGLFKGTKDLHPLRRVVRRSTGRPGEHKLQLGLSRIHIHDRRRDALDLWIPQPLPFPFTDFFNILRRRYRYLGRRHRVGGGTRRISPPLHPHRQEGGQDKKQDQQTDAENLRQTFFHIPNRHQ